MMNDDDKQIKGIELKPEINHKAIGQVKVSSHKKVDILHSIEKQKYLAIRHRINPL